MLLSLAQKVDPEREERNSISDADQVKAYDSKRRLATFFRHGWHVLEPETPLEWNWHLDAMCDHIQVALEDWMAMKIWQMKRARTKEAGQQFFDPKPFQRIKDLIINVPPGSSKSRIVCVYTLPWMWLHWPSWGAIYLSSNPRVALRDALYCRDVLTSSWYQSWFSPSWVLREDQNALSSYGNSAGGARMAFGYFARIVGDRKDALFLDDPNDPEEAQSERRRRAINLRWDSSIGNRVNDLRICPRFGVQQRVEANDWTGHVNRKGGFTHLCIPMEFEPQRLKEHPDPDKHEIPVISPIGWKDPRTHAGQLLDEVRFPPEVIAAEKVRLGSYGAAGQLQQRPSPAEGGIWKRRWWGYWLPSGIELPPVEELLADGTFHRCQQVTLPGRFEFALQSWDMAFGKSETSSMVVGQIWKLAGRDRFLLDQVREQLDFTETQSAFRQLSGNWPEVETKLVENKANGPAIISSLRGEFSGIIPVEPDGDKVARALAEQGTLESGHVFLPHPGLFSPVLIGRLEVSHPPLAAMLRRALVDVAKKGQKEKRDVASVPNWVDAFVDNAAAFPNGVWKDEVDTASQALNRIRKYIKVRDLRNNNQSQGSTSWTSSR